MSIPDVSLTCSGHSLLDLNFDTISLIMVFLAKKFTKLDNFKYIYHISKRWSLKFEREKNWIRTTFMSTNINYFGLFAMLGSSCHIPLPQSPVWWGWGGEDKNNSKIWWIKAGIQSVQVWRWSFILPLKIFADISAWMWQGLIDPADTVSFC